MGSLPSELSVEHGDLGGDPIADLLSYLLPEFPRRPLHIEPHSKILACDHLA
jgi:hypothetical protein